MIRQSVLTCLLSLGIASTALATVKTTVEHVANDAATKEFKFKTVPAPSKDDAATKAKFTIVDGEADPAGAPLDVVHDGKLPEEQDEPASNFFFNAGTSGGRIVIDLGAAIDIAQINTYSWHPDTRGPQVYTLYISEGTDKAFNPAPKAEVDPTQAGWKKIAAVDTRRKEGDSGGQHAVSTTDTDGSLGKARYVLLVVSRTESDDDFGNTFFSEIDVVAKAPAK